MKPLGSPPDWRMWIGGNDMIAILIIVIVLGAVFSLAFSLTGALIGALLWMIKLPVVLAMWAIGAVLCCTIILIPVGLLLFKSGGIILAV